MPRLVFELKLDNRDIAGLSTGLDEDRMESFFGESSAANETSPSSDGAFHAVAAVNVSALFRRIETTTRSPNFVRVRPAHWAS